ncbi:MAG: DNA polymerase III subunit gamma/tau [Planctomycetes bacterium]|nr:DNA polymerase III subunit gamma/tau [Planctomycetota bacterium]
MSYTVLARRYRSQTFDDVVGQDVIAQTLKNAIQGGKVAHAYLFCGTRGVGKTTMARILAKSLNCLAAKDATTSPCLKCDSCIAINAGEDIDVVEIDGASNRGIDNIRELRQNAIYRPARARYKIYIVDEVHMLTTEAFNALLKILEEPPAHVKFIFATTEPNKVLPTIQSRCQRFDFASIGPQVIAKQLDAILKIEKITFEPDFLPQLARLANGSMRDALSLLDQLISTGQQPLTAAMLEQLLGRPDAENLNLLIQHIAAADPAQTLKSIEILLNQGQSASQIAESLVEMFRDMMVLKTAGDGTDILLLSCSSATTLNQLSQTFDIPWLVFAITTLERLRWTLRNSETARALLEATLLRLAMSEHFISLDALTEQLRGAGGSIPASADIKKKTIISSGNPPLFQAAAAKTPAVQQPIPSGQTEPGSIGDIWRQLVEKMQAQNSQTGGFLSQARPGQLRNNTLTLRFSSPLALDMIKKKDDQLCSILKDILGREITVQYESAKPEDTAAATQPSAPAPAGARINRQQQEQALSDPAVQMIIRGLSANPVQIDRIEELEPPRHETEETDV